MLFSRQKSIILFAVLLFFARDSYSQKVTGTIKDKATKEVLIGATVVEKGTSTGTMTDFNGKFELTLDLSSPRILVISYLGYETTEIEVSDQKRYAEISLGQNIVTSQEVVVSSSRISEKLQESPVTVERLNIAAIKETPAVGFYEGLANLKGVDMTSASLGFKIINTRGFNSTSPVRTLQLIDGMDNQAPGLNFALGNFVGSSELDIESVDLIVGANSATYGPNAFNGVINMTTKDPFKYRGLNVLVKGGSRNLFDGAIRYAGVVREVFGYKFNLSYLRADDWIADNIAATDTSFNPVNDPKVYNYDAINTYGDEFGTAYDRTQIRHPDKNIKPIYIYRTGYKEKDLADYDTRCLKLNGGLYYKFRKDIIASYLYGFGTGTTVYQGDNRYAIKDILFQQHKVQLSSDRLMIRAYTTLENAGNSYDIVFTAIKLQENAKENSQWNNDFFKKYETIKNNYAGATNLQDSIRIFEEKMAICRAFADGQGNNPNSEPFFEPGTARFDSAFRAITSKSSFLDLGVETKDVGTLFQDRSSLSHFDASYDFNLSKLYKHLPANFKVGGSYRMYRPHSFGTIFSDTLVRDSASAAFGTFKKIEADEYGCFINTNKKVLREKLNLIGSLRYDDHKNFKPSFSPSFSAVYEVVKHNHIRFTYSTAFRNPTLQDQYLYYNIGRAILTGNLDGKDLILLRDFLGPGGYLDSAKIIITHIAPVKPEQVKTVEVGYKGIIGNIYVDASYYFSRYKDFLGHVIAAEDPTGKSKYQFYRVATNAKDEVTSQGFGIGLNYYFKKHFGISGNYTYAELDKKESTDPLLPSFNTPRHKYNLSFNGRNIHKFGFNVNYKWVEGFEFTGSPQFTGKIPAYDLVDAQVNYKWTAFNTTFKLGASNILDNQHYEAYGAPLIGRMGYFSISYEL